MTEYANAAGFKNAVTSKLFQDIGVENRDGKPGFRLIESRPDYSNGRAMRSRLSKIGTALEMKIIRALKPEKFRR
jgi:hypothetical protein